MAMGADQGLLDKYKKKLTPAQLAQENLNKAINAGSKFGEVWQAWFETISRIMAGPFMTAMRRFAGFVMSGRGGKGIVQVFGFLVIK